MLKLFQSIFGGGETSGRYPEALIDMATERAVDGTDPRLRALSGYRKRLRAPIMHAIDHVLALVDSLPAPLPATLADFSGDSRLAAVFASAAHMREVFAGDTMLGELRDKHRVDGPVTALLLAERVEKNVLGAELHGEMLKRDVAQVAVNFCGHRLVDPDTNEAETRRLLKRRAFDHLLSLALLRITEVRGERADLNRRRDLLRRKLRALEHGGWGFDAAEGERPEPAQLQTELADVEEQLSALGVDDRSLSAHLDVTIDLLGGCERQLWSEDILLHLDRMNIKRSANDGSARPLLFQELHNARGQRLTMLLLSIDTRELPERVDLVTAAQRYLV